MIEIRLNCEHCNRSLPANSKEALICSYECTWCTTCNDTLLKNVCPNCGGGLEKRPIRPTQALEKHPASTKVVFKPIDLEGFIPKREALKETPPEKR